MPARVCVVGARARCAARCGTTADHCDAGCQTGYGSCNTPPPPSLNTVCGNGVCEIPYLPVGETCGNCPADCGPCQPVEDASGCVEQGVFALTIDDGPSNVTPQMLTNLANAGVKASFFLLGTNVDKFPGTVTSEFQAQHSLNSHGYSHADFLKLALSEVCVCVCVHHAHGRGRRVHFVGRCFPSVMIVCVL